MANEPVLTQLGLIGSSPLGTIRLSWLGLTGSSDLEELPPDIFHTKLLAQGTNLLVSNGKLVIG
jgi:hypothetical protein